MAKGRGYLEGSTFKGYETERGARSPGTKLDVVFFNPPYPKNSSTEVNRATCGVNSATGNWFKIKSFMQNTWFISSTTEKDARMFYQRSSQSEMPDTLCRDISSLYKSLLLHLHKHLMTCICRNNCTGSQMLSLLSTFYCQSYFQNCKVLKQEATEQNYPYLRIWRFVVKSHFPFTNMWRRKELPSAIWNRCLAGKRIAYDTRHLLLCLNLFFLLSLFQLSTDAYSSSSFIIAIYLVQTQSDLDGSIWD